MNCEADGLSEFERDVIADERICTLTKEDPSFAQEMYSALCNVIWASSDNREFRATWRYAGQFVARIAAKGGDYLDYFSSGKEGRVSARIEAEMQRIGWSWKHYWPACNEKK